ncbi:uncharacterized protein LOC100901467 [Galendromus occidentalis]|uniref:Uncharacterized protein LOC100901467 n=1 Tax=Galendromus occidentalis TaxID=34638 RepID=A0AAJ6W0S9_9ACAR|nr:uncharacterized protein LOC100901467 [Galendromus occidentalis]
MKGFASVALLATLVFISAEARPSEDDLIVDFAVGRSEEYSMLIVADFLEKYGKKLAMVGRIISKLGDSMTGFGRWLKTKRLQGTQGDFSDTRDVIAKIGEELSVRTMVSSEAKVASRILAAACKQVAEDKTVPDSQLENYLSVSLAAISERMISSNLDADVVDTEKVDEASIEILERVVSAF